MDVNVKTNNLSRKKLNPLFAIKIQDFLIDFFRAFC